MSQNWSQIIEGLIGYYLDPNWNEHHNQSRRLFENREYQYRVFRRNIQEIFDVDILENMSIEDALAKFGIAPWLENWNISLDLSNVTAIFKFEIYRVENVLCGDSQYSSPSFNSADSLFEAWEIFLISLRRVEEEGISGEEGAFSLFISGFLTLKMLIQEPIREVIHGTNKQKVFNQIYDNFIVFDAESRTECMFKSFFKGAEFLLGDLDRKRKMALLKGKALYQKSHNWKKRLIKHGYIQKEIEPTLDILVLLRRFYEVKTQKSFKIVVFNISFDEIKVLNSINSVGTLYLRNVQKHMQVLLPLNELKNILDENEFKMIQCENRLYKSKVKDLSEVFWFNGENKFYFEGKEYTRAGLDERLYREGKINLVYRQVKGKKDYGVKNMMKFWSLDIETYSVEQEKGDLQIPFLIGLYDGNQEDRVFQWEGEGCVKKMYLFMEENPELFDNTTIYAHNGGKFDYFLCLKTLLEEEDLKCRLDTSKCFIICGGITAFAIHWGKFTVYFKDSVRIIPSSLKMAAYSFQTKHKKQEFDIEKAVKNWQENETMIEIKKYHALDLLTLWDVVKEFQSRFYKLSEGMDIVRFMTASQASVNIFLRNFLKQNILYTPPIILDKMFRNYYYGGRCELGVQGYVEGNILFFDINSLYPSVMLKKLPMSKYKILNRNLGLQEKLFQVSISGQDFLEEEFFGFVHCKVRQKDYEKWKKYPQYVPYHTSKLLLFPFYDEWFETLLFSEEIKMLQNTEIGGYEFQFENFFVCEGGKYLKNCIEHLYEVKKQAGLEGDEAMRTVTKVMLNSLYGYFGINSQRTVTRFLSNAERYILDDAFLSGSISDINQIGNTVILQNTDFIDITCSKVDTASAITAYARMKQWTYLCEIVRNGHEFLFGDTDSMCIKINSTMNEFKESLFYKVYCKGGQEEILGREKDEFWKQGKKVFKEDFQEYLDRFDLKVEDELCPIQKVCVVAAKGYYCIGDFEKDGQSRRIEKKALKGAKLNLPEQEVDFEKFKEKLIDNDELRITQTAFKSGQPSFFDHLQPLHVIIDKKVEKVFKKIYNKGKVANSEAKELGKTYANIYPYCVSEIEKVTGLPIQKYPISKVVDCFK